MSLVSALCSILAADDAVTALVRKRIRPLKLSQQDELPAITVRCVENPVTDLSRTVADMGFADATFSCWSRTQEEADSVAAAVRAKLAPFSGTQGAYTIDGCTEENVEIDLAPEGDGGDDTDRYSSSVAFQVDWRRT